MASRYQMRPPMRSLRHGTSRPNIVGDTGSSPWRSHQPS
jgi:hypothetical protein